MIHIIIRMARINHAMHLLSMKHIFLEVNTAFLYIQEKDRINHLENTKFNEQKECVLIDNSKY